MPQLLTRSVMALALLAGFAPGMVFGADGTVNATIAAPAPPVPRDLDSATGITFTFIGRLPAGDEPAHGLHFTTDPANARQIISKGVQLMENSGRWPPEVPQVDVGLPLATYTVSASGNLLTSGNLDAEAKFTGYEYIIKNSTKLIAKIEAEVDPASGNFKFGSVGLDPTKVTNEAISQVAALGPVKAGSYEPRLLTMIWRGTRNSLLWLKSAPGGTDLIYPAFAYPEQYGQAGLKEKTLYTLPDFLAALRATRTQTGQSN